MISCPLCECPSTHPLMSVEQRDYWRCDACQATFLHPAQLPELALEREIYALHDNTTDDPGYRRFLARLSEPLLAVLPPRQQGLDYGCGPGPALARLMEQAGHNVSLYDPLFQPDAAVLQRQYDFITCSEVVEHFHHPAAEFRRLDALLRPGGRLAIMTCFQTDDARFAAWHYRRDPTHVVFYREATLRHLARTYGWDCEIPCKDVALMHKRG